MTDFATLSQSIAATARGAAGAVAALEWGGRHHISAVLWRAGVLVTSAQSLPESDGHTAILPGGARVPASLKGRDPTTNVAVLTLEAPATALASAEPDGVGELILALGSDGTGEITARMGAIEVLGPAWESQRGGKIDRLIRLGVRLGPAAEGGPVLSAHRRPARHVHVRPAQRRAGDPERHHRPRGRPVAGGRQRCPRLARRRAAPGRSCPAK